VGSAISSSGPQRRLLGSALYPEQALRRLSDQLRERRDPTGLEDPVRVRKRAIAKAVRGSGSGLTTTPKRSEKTYRTAPSV